MGSLAEIDRIAVLIYYIHFSFAKHIEVYIANEGQHIGKIMYFDLVSINHVPSLLMCVFRCCLLAYVSKCYNPLASIQLM